MNHDAKAQEIFSASLRMGFSVADSFKTANAYLLEVNREPIRHLELHSVTPYVDSPRLTST